MITNSVFVLGTIIGFYGAIVAASPAFEKSPDAAEDIATSQHNISLTASNVSYESSIGVVHSEALVERVGTHSHYEHHADEVSSVSLLDVSAAQQLNGIPKVDGDLGSEKQPRTVDLADTLKSQSSNKTNDTNNSSTAAENSNSSSDKANPVEAQVLTTNVGAPQPVVVSTIVTLPSQPAVAAPSSTSSDNLDFNRLLRYMQEKANSEINLLYRLMGVIKYQNYSSSNPISNKTMLSTDELNKLKQAVFHQLFIAQDHVLQYEQYRYQSDPKTMNGIPDLWIETYNVETAAMVALSAESSSGETVRMDIQCIVETQIDGNLKKFMLFPNSKPMKEMRPFEPLLNKHKNGVLIKGIEQHETIFSDHRTGQRIIAEYFYKDKLETIRYNMETANELIDKLKTAKLSAAETEKVKGDLSDYVYDIQQLTVSVWLSRPIPDTNSADVQMEDLFKIVYANLMSAATVLNVDEATDIQVNYINGKYVVESEEGDILIKTKRERAEKPIFYKFSEIEKRTFGKLKVDALQARCLMFMQRLRREFTGFKKLLASLRKVTNRPDNSYQETVPNKLGLIQAYVLAILRMNRNDLPMQELYEKLYNLESDALDIVSPLNLLTTFNKYGRVHLNYSLPKVLKEERPSIPGTN